MNNEKEIPSDFLNEETGPAVFSVGDLIHQLEKLPLDLNLGTDGYGLMVYNADRESIHLHIEDLFG